MWDQRKGLHAPPVATSTGLLMAEGESMMVAPQVTSLDPPAGLTVTRGHTARLTHQPR